MTDAAYLMGAIGLLGAGGAVAILLSIIFRYIPPIKRRPLLMFGTIGIIAVITPWVWPVPATVTTRFFGSALCAIVIYWGYSQKLGNPMNQSVKTWKQDITYYVPRWLAFGVLVGFLGGGVILPPNGNTTMPNGYYWHVILYQHLPIGIIYGLLSGVLFVFLQRLWNTDGKRVKWWVNVLAAIIVVTIGIFGAQTAINQTLAESQTTQGVIQGLAIKAQKDYPNLSYTEANRQESIRQANAALTGATSQLERAQNAAGTFLGFYFGNTRARSEFCKNLGVDISKFLQGFNGAFKAEYDKAILIIGRDGVTAPQVWEASRDQLLSFTAKNMVDLAQRQHMSTADVCRQVEQMADYQIKRQTDLFVNSPTDQALMSTQ